MPGKDPCAARPAETDRSAILRGSRLHGRARNAVASMAHQAQTPSLGESDAPSMHSRPKADRRGRSCMATASPKTPKSSAIPVKRPHRVQMCAGCSHMLLVCMGQVRPTTAPPPPTNHHPPLLNQGRVHSTSGRIQTKHESETQAMTTETLNGLWHTDCGIQTATIPRICHINMKRKAWWLGLLSLLKRWFCCC